MRYTGSTATTNFVNNGILAESLSKWTNAPESSTGSTYNPPSISSKTTYIRRASSGGQIKYSNAIMYKRYTATTASEISSGISRCGTGGITFTLGSRNGTVKYWRMRYKNGSGSWSGYSTITNSNVSSVTPTLTEWSGGTRTWEIQVKVQNGPCLAVWKNRSVTVYPSAKVPVVSFNNSSTVCSGTSVTFSSSSNYDKWYTTASGGSPFHTGSSLTQTLTSTTTYYVAGGSASCGVTSTRTPVTVNVYNTLSPGTISYNGSSTEVALGEVPANFAGSAVSDAQGVSYQWQQKPFGNSFFTNIAGATSQNLTLSEALPINTSFRRLVLSNSCSVQEESNVILLQVEESPGLIGSDQIVCSNDQIVPISSIESAGGGTGNYLYFWEYRRPGEEFTILEGEFTSGETLDVFGDEFLSPSFPGMLDFTGTIEFRRGIQSFDEQTQYTNIISITSVGEFETPDVLGISYDFDGASYDFGNHPDIAFYWQDSETGESTSQPNSSYKVTSPGTYYVRAHNTIAGCWSEASMIQFDLQEPIIEVQSMSHRSILVSWSGTLGNEQSFKISRATAAEGPFTQLAFVDGQTTEYLDLGLEMGTSYYYRVQAVANTVYSTGATVASATTNSAVAPLNYVYQRPAHNGNISAIRWKGVNDEKESVYTYTYDGLNRLTMAMYGAGEGNSYDDHRGNFAVPDLKYDLNGNIMTLTRQGITEEGNPVVIDHLSYDYSTGGTRSNQLLAVSDSGTETGFMDGNTTGDDYAYDANGNMVKDLNKDIDTIYYNHLNLPIKVVMSPSGGGQTGLGQGEDDRIEYLYDAAGIKLSQSVYKGGVLQKKTDYVGEFIYETDSSGVRTLQLIQHEEGRIIPKYAVSQPELVEGYDYQYHLKDHLGNVRVTFSTTLENYTMVETFETGEENGWQDLHRHTSIDANTTAGGDEVELLQSGQTGAMIFVGVNKRDTIHLSVNANYEAAPGDNNFAGTAYSSLFGSYNGTFGGGEANNVLENEFGDALNGADMAGKGDATDAPRAFLNYIYFDQDMNYVRAGFQQISTAALGVGIHETISINDIIADQEGYILAYLSNENQEAVNIHFDDFTVYHGKTNVVSTQDYYPFGLVSRSSSRTASTEQKYLFNGKELQEETGWYDYGRRMYQADLGRFMVHDRFTEMFFDLSSYQYAANNPISFVDINGDSIVSITRSGQDIIIENSPIEEGGDNFNNTITLDSNVSGNDVSDYSAGIVNDAMVAIGDNSVTVSSGSRTPEEQAEVMYNNLENGTVAGEKKTYGASGDKVIDAYVKAKNETKAVFTSCDAQSLVPTNSPSQIKKQMLNKINTVGPNNVSKHTVSDASKLNVFDIRPSTVSNSTKFHNTLSKDSRVRQVWSKVNKPAEKAIHVEIVQKKQ